MIEEGLERGIGMQVKSADSLASSCRGRIFLARDESKIKLVHNCIYNTKQESKYLKEQLNKARKRVLKQKQCI